MEVSNFPVVELCNILVFRLAILKHEILRQTRLANRSTRIPLAFWVSKGLGRIELPV
jgi:hypothetical protein